ncbi:PREDICTED: prefoldin subunit 1 [Papilio xuthus]|uniref:Prefoldin subunit 1 n=1 Tax=Papilio xuthus TaxID=66420 RepID=I4DK04_PAPXU|nr:prefoldin subunit 1 [Papilio xuthus]KPI96077.1 Prefoldin subunit 1 [Papilio xuthus]BAM18244.1 unknown unsecreted protein [Papilio xuthus]
MAKLVDLELKKAFSELQVKIVETRKKINVIDVQITALNKVLKYIDSSRKELQVLENDTKAYIPVSRMFLQADLGELKESIDDRVCMLNERIVELENKKEYLERKRRESEDNIREMIQLRKVQFESEVNKMS